MPATLMSYWEERFAEDSGKRKSDKKSLKNEVQKSSSNKS